MSSTTPKEPKITKKVTAKAAMPKTPSSHPPYKDMILAAMTKLALEKKSATLIAISNHITNTYAATNSSHLKLSLKRLLDKGDLTKRKGIGLTGSFKLSKTLQTAAKKKKTPASKKAAKKPASPKKAKPATAPTKKLSPKKSPAKAKPKAKPKDAKKPKKTTKAATKPAAKTKKPAAKKPKTPKKPATKKK